VRTVSLSSADLNLPSSPPLPSHDETTYLL
jgi:hypothetical protein